MNKEELLPDQAILAIEHRLKEAYSHGDTWLLGHADDAEIDFHKEVAESNIIQAWHALINLLETYGHSSLLAAARADYETCKKDPTDSAMGVEDPYLIWPYEIRKYTDIFKELHIPKQETALPSTVSALIQAIRNSEYFITSPRVFTWMPAREDDVHRRIEGMLKCFYPDLLHKPTLSKAIKSFEADTGIPSLQVLIDYKFVATQDAGKRILDEVLADIGGYQSDLYNQFVFVIYETWRCFSEDEWNQAITSARPRNPVVVVILKGSPPTSQDRDQSDSMKRSFDKAKAEPKKSPNKASATSVPAPGAASSSHQG